MTLVLGVDSSTQATKVEIRDADTGRLVAAGRAPHPAVTPPRSEADPATWWRALRDATRTAGRADVAAMAVAAQQHGLVALDVDGDVIRPAKLWNDTESGPDAAALVARLGAQEWARRAGSVPVAAFTITKLAWLAGAEPEHFARLDKALLPHDWLNWKLTGRFVTDRGDASGTGYFSPSEGRWLPDLLELVDDRGEQGWLDTLPEVVGPTEAIGETVGAARDDLGLARPVVVAPGTGDNMAAALGAGLRTGDVAVSLGTSGTVYAIADRPTADATGAVAGFCDATGRYLPLVCVLNATLVADAFAHLLGLPRDELEVLAIQAPPGAGGVVLVPHLAGERTPDRPDATGTLTGLRPDTERGHLARAAYEGVVCGLLEGLDALEAAGVPTSEGRLVLVGGGARSEVWPRMLADLAQRPVTIVDGEEHVAKGAAMQAAAVLRDATPDEVGAAWGTDGDRLVEPDPSVDAPAVRSAFTESLG